MVAKIIRSEFILNRNTLLVFLAEIVAFVIIYIILMSSETAVLALATIFIGVLPASVLSRQSKFKADNMICSLPVTRNRFILGKYSFVGILTLGFLCIVYIIVALMPHEGFSTREILQPDKIANTLFAIALVAGVLLPLVIRFGFTGLLILFLGLNLITVVIFALTYLKLINNALDFIFSSIPSAFSTLKAALGTPYYHLVFIGAAVIIGFASLKISQLIYRRREF